MALFVPIYRGFKLMKVVVWSKPLCPNCDRAKALLTAKSIAYEERTIGDGWTKEQLQEVAPAARSVPQVFIDDQLIGGFNELYEHLKG